MSAADLPFKPGWRTWDDSGARCDHCCNKDGCDDSSHYERCGKPGCPHCLNTGFALWTEAGQREYDQNVERVRRITVPQPAAKGAAG